MQSNTLKEDIIMEWWVWLLIVIAGIAIAYVKIAFLKSMQKKSKTKKKFTDED